MFLYLGHFIILKCFSTKFNQKSFESDDRLNGTWSYDFNLDGIYKVLNGEEDNTNNLDNTSEAQTGSENLPENANKCPSDFTNNLQGQLNELPSSSQYFSHNNSYYENSMIQNNVNTYINTQDRYNEETPTFTTSQPRKYVASNIPICFDGEGEMTNFRRKYTGALNYTNTLYDSKFNENELLHETGKRVIQVEENMNESENKKLKMNCFPIKYPENYNNSCASNIMNNLESQNLSDVACKKVKADFNSNQLSVPIGESTRILQKATYSLNMLKTYEARFLNYKIQNKSFYETISSDLNELTEVTEDVKKLCKRWIEKDISIESSENNRNAFEILYRLALDVCNSIQLFNKLIEEIKWQNLSTEKFADNSRNLKRRIEENKKLQKQLEKDGINKILDEENSENNLIENDKMRSIKFLYQKKNSSNILNFNFFVKKGFYPVSKKFFWVILRFPHTFYNKNFEIKFLTPP